MNGAGKHNDMGGKEYGSILFPEPGDHGLLSGAFLFGFDHYDGAVVAVAQLFSRLIAQDRNALYVRWGDGCKNRFVFVFDSVNYVHGLSVDLGEILAYIRELD